MVIWLVGLSGSGKTTLGHEMVRQWRLCEPNVVILDGDELRALFAHDRGDIVGAAGQCVCVDRPPVEGAGFGARVERVRCLANGARGEKRARIDALIHAGAPLCPSCGSLCLRVEGLNTKARRATKGTRK